MAVLMGLAIVFLVFFRDTAEAIALHPSQPQQHHNNNLLPASRLVSLELHHVKKNDMKSFEEESHQYKKESSGDSLRFATLLKRRDGIDLYGRTIVHQECEPKYAHLSIHSLPDNNGETIPGKKERYVWEATLLLTPENHIEHSLDNDKCFVAMNRFSVKQGCEAEFEKRWAERNTKLPSQPGFLGFSLLRKRQGEPSLEGSFNYSTCTLWASHGAWTNWRGGQGRLSHDASRGSDRTPTSEWLTCPASPIFWDGLGTVVAECGV